MRSRCSKGSAVLLAFILVAAVGTEPLDARGMSGSAPPPPPGPTTHPVTDTTATGAFSPLVTESAQVAGGIPEISPGGAFLRSLAVPGWGHAATGSHFRGAFYVAAQSGTWWMLAKSVAARSEARRFRAEERRSIQDRLRASGVLNPDSLRVLAANDPRMEEWDELVERRGEQVEDWVALAIFMTLLSATDAFVAGHLMDPPEPLSLIAAPRPDGGWEVGVSLRMPSLPFRP
jgi:hypothetical protein